MNHLTAFTGAIGLFGVWTLATYLLEGRRRTLLRPEATGARLAYAVIANVVIGIGGAVLLVRLMLQSDPGLRPVLFGFSQPIRSLAYVGVALVLGVFSFGVQRPASWRPLVLVNGFCQTLVVSIAEVLVCWSVLGTTVSTLPLESGRAVALGVGVAAVAFGVYHVAHSPPFNTRPMVALLTGVGLFIGAFFFLVRDVYATIVLHNFMALRGVTQALEESARLDQYRRLQLPLVAMAAAAVFLLVVLDLLIVRSGMPG